VLLPRPLCSKKVVAVVSLATTVAPPTVAPTLYERPLTGASVKVNGLPLRRMSTGLLEYSMRAVPLTLVPTPDTSVTLGTEEHFRNCTACQPMVAAEETFVPTRSNWIRLLEAMTPVQLTSSSWLVWVDEPPETVKNGTDCATTVPGLPVSCVEKVLLPDGPAVPRVTRPPSLSDTTS
jgi:hypothetical protein